MLTVKQVLEVINFNPGSCLCTMRESCSVCSRSSKTREFERNAQLAAISLLEHVGIELVKEEPEFLTWPTVYRLKDEQFLYHEIIPVKFSTPEV